MMCLWFMLKTNMGSYWNRCLKSNSIPNLSMGSAPVGVQCPLTSSLGEFLGYWADSGILGYYPCWCPRLSLRLPYLGVFPFTLSPAIGFHSCFLLRSMYLHLFGQHFT